MIYDGCLFFFVLLFIQATCFFFLQAFNWLLRSVSQPTALHDLLWHFVASLATPNADPDDPDDPQDPAAADQAAKKDQKRDEVTIVTIYLI